MTRIATTLLLTLIGFSPVLGCASSARPPVAPARDYTVAFRAGNFAEAARIASLAPAQDDQARLIEGMSRAELGQTDQAESLLRPLLRSSRAEIRGRAAATLGLLALDRGETSQAARQLEVAADNLSGSDAVWAAHYAVRAQKADGDARPSPRLVNRAAPASRLLDQSAGSGYSIQFGSFSTEARAVRHAQAVSRLTRASGIPAPRIETVQRGARTLYSVRSGSFSTKSAAARAAAGLDTDTTVVLLQ